MDNLSISKRHTNQYVVTKSCSITGKRISVGSYIDLKRARLKMHDLDDAHGGYAHRVYDQINRRNM